jgi:A/G-specific adenine glycosylase
VNIRRILTRLSNKISSPREMVDEQRAWTLADAILCRTDVYSWNQALMDLGATICTPSRPDCVRCPVSRFCRSAFSPALNKRTAAAPKTEPEWKGIPRRLYRGKILAMLHGKPSTTTRIANQLWSPATRKDLTWLERVLAMMEKDGLIRRKGRSYGIA